MMNNNFTAGNGNDGRHGHCVAAKVALLLLLLLSAFSAVAVDTLISDLTNAPGIMGTDKLVINTNTATGNWVNERTRTITVSNLLSALYGLSNWTLKNNFFATNQLADAIEQTNTIILSGFHLALKTNDISGANGTYTWNGSTKYVFNVTNTISLIGGQWTFTNGMTQIAPPTHSLFAADLGQTPTATPESYFWYDDIGIITGQALFTRTNAQTLAGPYLKKQSDNSTNLTLWGYTTLGNDGTGIRWNGGGGNFGSGLDLIPVFNPIMDGGQRILYFGGQSLSGKGLEAASVQIINTNSSGQTNGLLAPRFTFAFLSPAANAGQTHSWRFLMNDLTLDNNTGGNATPESIIHHDNTTNIAWGAKDYTNFYGGKSVIITSANLAIGPFAKSTANNSISVGNNTNVDANSAYFGDYRVLINAGSTAVKIGPISGGNFPLQVAPTATTIFGNSFASDGSMVFSGALELDNGLNVASGTISGVGSGLTGVPATSLTGTIAAGQMPAHTGAITTSAGSVATALGSFTSANLSGALTDESGSGLAIFQTSPTIITPTIASFANANHNHQNSAGGGTLGITSMTMNTARLLGRTTAASGTVEEITVGSGLTLSAGSLTASGSAGLGYTLALFSTANTTPATSTTYFFGGCPGVAGNTTIGTATVDIPKAGTLKRVFYKIRNGTVDTTEANGVVHSIRLNNTTDVASQTFAYTQAATNVINSSVSQAVAVGDTVVLKVVTPASWTVSPAGMHVYVTLYIE